MARYVVRKYAALTGSGSRIVHVPYAEAYEEGFEDMRRRVPDVTKLEQVTGFRPSIGLDQTLLEVIDYFMHAPSQRPAVPT